jgi:hypothetical protein
VFMHVYVHIFVFVVKSYVCLSVRPPIWAGLDWKRVLVFLTQSVY